MFTWKWHWKFPQKKNCILKDDLAFHQVKEELWNLWDMLLGVLQSLWYFVFSKYAEMRLIITLLQFFFEAAPIFQYVYLDFLRPLPRNSQNVCMWRILRLKMWNSIAHICDIITAYQIYKMIFLGVAITHMNKNWQLGSKQYTMITVYYDSKQYIVIKQICIRVCLRKWNCMLKWSETKADFKTYPQRITLMQLWQLACHWVLNVLF